MQAEEGSMEAYIRWNQMRPACLRRAASDATMSMHPPVRGSRKRRGAQKMMQPAAPPALILCMMLSAATAASLTMVAMAFVPSPFNRQYVPRTRSASVLLSTRTHAGNQTCTEESSSGIGLEDQPTFNQRPHKTKTINGARRRSNENSRPALDEREVSNPNIISEGGNFSSYTMKNNSLDAMDYDSLYYECDVATDGENDAVDDLFTSLLAKVASYYPEAVIADASSNSTTGATMPVLRQAYQYARAAHEGQCRKSGEPYITHPLGVAHIIAKLRLDLPSLLTALLHDTVEDTSVTLEDISANFGEEIAQLVDGVTKVGKIHRTSNSQEERQSENYRKLILSMSRDIRVLLVKLADRAHNMRTLQYMAPEKQRRIAKETMEIYAPLAHRLGMHQLKTELEDSCFKYLYPEKYDVLVKQMKGSEEERKRYEEEVVGMLVRQMKDAGLGGKNADGKNSTLQVTGRTKGLYSIYNKMRKKQISNFDDVHDVIGFRIVVDDEASCYQALGTVHSHFKPVPGKIKDYIALPKPNGYRSLHTTIIGPKGKLEVQIRTSEMHDIAESGIAAHWMYKQGSSKKDQKEGTRFAWLRELVQEVRQQSDPKEFVKSVKEDLYSWNKEVFVFTPQGDLFALARGSSVLDLAFKVHSQLGAHCVGAKVNGKLVTLRHLIQNGDTVEILTSNQQTPKREWLKYVRTSKAKNRIRSWLKRKQKERSLLVGKTMLDQGLKKYSPHGEEGRKEYQRKLTHLLTTFKLKDEPHLFSALGYGQITLEGVMTEIFGSAVVKTRGRQDKREKSDKSVLKRSHAAQQSHSNTGKSGIIVGKEKNIKLQFCKNCAPLQGESVRGIVSQGHGVKVHRTDCKYLLDADEDRIVDVQWDGNAENIRLRPVRLELLCEDTPGVLANISRAITALGINIGNVNLKRLSNGRGLARLAVMLGKLEELEKVMAHLRQEEGVLSVSRK